MPNSPGGSTGVLGTYYVTIPQARGFTYLLKATATVDGTSITLFRIAQIRNIVPPSYYAVYSLRKAVDTYAGKAVKVRCVATAQNIDIGFTGSGDFDIADLRNRCFGDTALPLDINPASNVPKMAYGLRKLRSAYSGPAIKVRKSSGGAVQDIGFDSNGNLDIAALSTFLGTSSGTVATWYDQSSYGKDATQSTASKQPSIVLNGVLQNGKNNTPIIVFDGVDDYLGNTTGLSAGHINSSNLVAFTVGRQDSTATSNVYSRFVVLHKSNTSGKEDWQIAGALQVLGTDGTYRALMTETNNSGVFPGNVLSSTNTFFQATTYHDSSNSMRLYVNGSLAGSDNTVVATFTPDQLYLGVTGYNTGIGTDFLKGGLSEVIIDTPTAPMAAADRVKIEKSQARYFKIGSSQDGFVMTWYDQSGNGRDLTQATAANQPIIDVSNIEPALYMNGTSHYLDNTTLNTTTDKITAFTVAQVETTPAASPPPSNGRIATIWQNGQSNDYGNIASSGLLAKLNSSGNSNFANLRNNWDLKGATTMVFGKCFQATTLFDGTNRVVRYKENGSALDSVTTTNNGSGNLVINNLRVAGGTGLASHEYWQGLIYELRLYDKALTATEYGNVETDMQTYFGIQ
jgi:hypothetical protein